MDVYEAVEDYLSRGQSGTIATIVKKLGAAPRDEGAKMFIGDDGRIFGTIGGGCVEAEIWTAARNVTKTQKPRMLSYRLDGGLVEDDGMICGGNVDIFLEPALPRYKNLYTGIRDLEKTGRDAFIITRFTSDSFSKSLLGQVGLISGDDLTEEMKEHVGSHLGAKGPVVADGLIIRAGDIVADALPVRRRSRLAIRIEDCGAGRF